MVELTRLEQKTKDVLVKAITEIKEAQEESGIPNIEVRHILKELETLNESFDFAMKLRKEP